MMNSKGQETATFELLVVAIMALAIMLIVLSISDYFSSLRFQASEKAFNSALKSAVNSPNGAVIIAEGIILHTGKKTTQLFSNEAAGLEPECFSIVGPESNSWQISEEGKTISILKSVETDVFFQCVLGGDYASTAGSCEESCRVSFGEDPEGQA